MDQFVRNLVHFWFNPILFDPWINYLSSFQTFPSLVKIRLEGDGDKLNDWLLPKCWSLITIYSFIHSFASSIVLHTWQLLFNTSSLHMMKEDSPLHSFKAVIYFDVLASATQRKEGRTKPRHTTHSHSHSPLGIMQGKWKLTLRTKFLTIFVRGPIHKTTSWTCTFSSLYFFILNFKVHLEKVQRSKRLVKLTDSQDVTQMGWTFVSLVMPRRHPPLKSTFWSCCSCSCFSIAGSKVIDQLNFLTVWPGKTSLTS